MKLPPALVRTAARQRHRFSAQLTADLVALASLLPTAAPVTALPRFERVLVLAPHPDDETIGCGGTIARLATHGADIEVVALTDGEATIGGQRSAAATAEARRSEAVAAGGLLGAGTVVSTGLPDRRLSAELPALGDVLDAAFERHQPQVVLLPWPVDGHPDHRAVTRALATLAPRPGCELYGYEVHTPILRPDRVVDVEVAVTTKRAALSAHRTAGQAFDLEATLGLARWRSLATTAGRGSAEAFLTLRWQDLPAWDAAAAQVWRAEG
ncbi:MAG: PIG-L deacetylase family protein [Nitriliruptoraceae bacterium]